MIGRCDSENPQLETGRFLKSSAIQKPLLVVRSGVLVSWALKPQIIGQVSHNDFPQFHFKGINRELFVLPIPGRPCRTGL